MSIRGISRNVVLNDFPRTSTLLTFSLEYPPQFYLAGAGTNRTGDNMNMRIGFKKSFERSGVDGFYLLDILKHLIIYVFHGGTKFIYSYTNFFYVLFFYGHFTLAFQCGFLNSFRHIEQVIYLDLPLYRHSCWQSGSVQVTGRPGAVMIHP